MTFTDDEHDEKPNIGYPKPTPKKKTPKPFSSYRKPIKKKAYKIKPKTTRRQEKESSMRKAITEKYSEVRCCSSCGRGDVGIEPSHIISKAHSFDLIDDINNIIPQCRNCHDLLERGHYYQLKDGLKVMEYIFLHRFELLQTNLDKFPQNMDLWRHSRLYPEYVAKIIL